MSNLNERLETLRNEYQILLNERNRLQADLSNVTTQMVRCEGAAQVLQEMIAAEQSKEAEREPV